MSIAVITDWEPVFDDRATGAKARALRKSKGFKSRAVSKLMGMTSSHYSEIESGKRGWSMDKVRLFEEAVEYLSQNAAWSDRLFEEMDEAGICTACGHAMTEVRPGKAQCDFCETEEYLKKAERRIVELERIIEGQYPDWVCNECGRAHGKRPEGNPLAATYHHGICDLCGHNTEVTEPRDWGHLRDSWKTQKHGLLK